jgi:hypothetical protein
MSSVPGVPGLSLRPGSAKFLLRKSSRHHRPVALLPRKLAERSIKCGEAHLRCFCKGEQPAFKSGCRLDLRPVISPYPQPSCRHILFQMRNL